MLELVVRQRLGFGVVTLGGEAEIRLALLVVLEPLVDDLPADRLSLFEGRERVAEPGSVGVLTWAAGAGAFEYVPADWLRRFTRHNWKHG